MKIYTLIRLLLITCLLEIDPPLYSQCTEIYGFTFGGGIDRAGSIFKTDANGNNLETLYSFPESGGQISSLCRANNGKLYGMVLGGPSAEGRQTNFGELCEWDPETDSYIRKFFFDDTSRGAFPEGGLIKAADGKLYGLTTTGGAHGDGVLFCWDPETDDFLKKVDFEFTDKGRYPRGKLTGGPDGKLYGMTSQGGAYGKGVLFEWDPLNETYTVKVQFNGENGQTPFGSLLLASNGKYYGVTYYGGDYDKGVLFEWDPNMDVLIKRFDFHGASGENPEGTLIESSNGKLMGTTLRGGIYSHLEPSTGKVTHGVLFEYDLTAHTYTKLFDFDGPVNGQYPGGNLVKAGERIIGATYSGGLNNMGVLFSLDPGCNNFEKLVDFNDTLMNGYLTQTDDGRAFFITHDQIIEWVPSEDSIESHVVKFNYAPHGRCPLGYLATIDSIHFYGMTLSGGNYELGALFEWNRITHEVVTKVNFDGNNGREPVGSLLAAKNGKFYGATYNGGHDRSGSFFEFDPEKDTLITKFEFTSRQSDKYPNGLLTQADNGKIYGVTRNGGTHTETDYSGDGTLFEWDPETGVLDRKVDFDRAETGAYPTGSLINAGNGTLYGLAGTGGSNSAGVLFAYDTESNTFMKKIEFGGSMPGLYPIGTLFMARNGNLLGMTLLGGDPGLGTFFQWNPATGEFEQGLEFEYGKIERPIDGFLDAKNGHYYFTASNSNSRVNNALFEWDPITGNLEKKYQFEGSKALGRLFELNTLIYASVSVSACDKYISASGKYEWTESGIYRDTIPSHWGCDSVITVNLAIRERSYATIDTTAMDSYVSPGGSTCIVTGTYYDTLANRAGCDSIITINLVIEKPSGVQSGLTGDIRAYPNPGKGELTVDLGQAYAYAELVITDLYGRIIGRYESFNTRELHVQMNVTPGIYIGSIQCGEAHAVVRILRE